MARQRIDAPAYRYHISGQARVTLAGKDFFLGKFGSPESKAKYYALLAEYNANGKRVPQSTPAQLGMLRSRSAASLPSFENILKLTYFPRRRTSPHRLFTAHRDLD